MRRHFSLKLFKLIEPVNMSLARAFAFNKSKIDHFFSNYNLLFIFLVIQEEATQNCSNNIMPEQEYRHGNTIGSVVDLQSHTMNMNAAI